MNKTGTLSDISMLFVHLYETNSECSFDGFFDPDGKSSVIYF